MLMLDLLFAFLVALILSLGFISWIAAERKAAGTSAISAPLFFFLILLFATWAGGVWRKPFGPPSMGVALLPVIFVGLFVALQIAAATDPSRRYMGSQRRVPRMGRATTSEETAEFAAVAFGMLFWILLVGLIVSVVSSDTMQ